MEIDSSDGPRLDDLWRAKLEEARLRCSADPNAETRSELRKVLRLFADLVMWGQLAPPLE
jgi:hypothetical protein